MNWKDKRLWIVVAIIVILIGAFVFFYVPEMCSMKCRSLGYNSGYCDQGGGLPDSEICRFGGEPMAPTIDCGEPGIGVSIACCCK